MITLSSTGIAYPKFWSKHTPVKMVSSPSIIEYIIGKTSADAPDLNNRFFPCAFDSLCCMTLINNNPRKMHIIPTISKGLSISQIESTLPKTAKTAIRIIRQNPLAVFSIGA